MLMKICRAHFGIMLIASALLGATVDSRGFALLGPIQPWMQESNGVVFPDNGDFGGPMCLSNSYRWNVPVITYGFDQSFLDYFGTNGVAAVTAAFQTLNNLPPASQLALTNYALEIGKYNYTAQDEGLFDLKSQTLC